MAAAVARDLDAPVPTCPAWNVAKLTIHTGQHHRWVADAVRRGGSAPEDPPKPGLRGDDLVEWFRQGWRDLADLLDATDDRAPAWTWSAEQRAGFWRRRTTLETLVHRWDAENAVGVTPAALDPALSADGIDEMLFVMVAQGDSVYRGEPVRAALSASDADGAWTIDLVDGEPPRPARGEGARAGDVTLTGPAEKLLLFLWGRVGPEAVDAGGDEEKVAALLRWIDE
jgi:uncharacterized protein (TIGR03083 family)